MNCTCPMAPAHDPFMSSGATSPLSMMRKAEISSPVK